MALMSDPMVSASWLRDRLGDPRVRPIDGTWFFPHEGRDAGAEFLQKRIPGAGRFDIDAVSDPQTDLPHMLPEPDLFARQVGALGVGDGDLVVAYETTAPRAAARVWWSFRAMGHEEVVVLDGGLPAWIAAGGALEGGAVRPEPARFTARPNPALVTNKAEVLAATAHGGQILDARPPARFAGTADEPRPGLRRGAIPSSRNVPGAELFDADGRLRPAEELRALLRARGADPDAGAVATCGSGITACLIALAYARLGRFDVAVYDGSFAEWGLPSGPPLAPAPGP